MQERARGLSGRQDRRGSYTRLDENGVVLGIRKAHAAYAYEHKQKAESFSIGRPCTSACPFGGKCGMDYTPRTLLACHQHSYGTKTVRADGGFGDEGEPLADTYACEFSQSKTINIWKSLASSCISWKAVQGADGSEWKREERFTVDSLGPVCAEYWAAAYGIRDTKTLLANARCGQLQQQQLEEGVLEGLRREGGIGRRELRDAQTSASKAECVEWWKLWLQLEDQMPNEPIIVHRIVIWASVYEEVHRLHHRL